MATKSSPPPPPHVVIFPYMAQGHTIPLLDLSKCLSRRALKVTIITTPANAPFITSQTANFPAISTDVIPFPDVPYLPKGCENTAALPSPAFILPFINATKLLKQPFEDILSRMSESDGLPICVVSDYFLGWTLDSCRLFGVPRIVSHGMGALPMLIIKGINLLVKEGKEKGSISSSFSPDEAVDLEVSGLRVPFELQKGDFPEAIWDSDLEDNEFLRIALELDEADVNSWGVVVNSFEELERDYIPALEDVYVEKESKAWCVGPLLLGGNADDDVEREREQCLDDPCINWLDQRVLDVDLSGAIYVSFGTQAHLGDDQMDEIAYGLEMAGEPFIWVIKSAKWTPPAGWEGRVKGLGFVTRDWVDQRRILIHPGIEGFLSHCGWNSVLEGLIAGVPLLAWPMGAEQPLNAKYVAMDLKMGLMVPQKTKTVDRGTIRDAVKELMRGDQGMKARDRVREFGRLARAAMSNVGSSHKKLDELIECLSSKPLHSTGV